MIREYSRDELIGLLLATRGYEPLEDGVALEASESLKEIMSQEVEQWYLKLVDEGPVELLGADDIRGLVMLSERDDGALTFTLPESVRRLTRLQLAGWYRPARIVGPDDPEAIRCQNPMWRNGESRPLAVVSGRGVEVYGGAPGLREVIVIEGVKEPRQGGNIKVDPRALETLLRSNGKFE